MDGPHLPQRNRDLARYVRRKRAVRLGLLALWTLLLVVGAILYNRSHEKSVLPPIVGWRMAAWIAAALVSGALLFRVPQLFFDRSFTGVILRSGLSHSYSASADPGATRASQDFRLNTVLRVRTDEGKIRRIRFEQKPGSYFYYHEGNRVCHISGLPYPVADPATMQAPPRVSSLRDEDSTGSDPIDPRASYVCAACGQFGRAPTVCARCGLSLIDPRDLFGSDGDTV